MLAATADGAFSREGWLFELKYDGYRILAERQGDEVLITDLRMPKLDGMKVLKAVSDRYPHVPVIMITGTGSSSTCRSRSKTRNPLRLGIIMSRIMRSG